MVNMSKNLLKKKRSGIKRYITLDAFRGLAVLFMIFVSALYLLTKNIPFLLLHNQGDVFLFFDLVAPIFQFTLGMSLFFSLLHHKLQGTKKSLITIQILWKYLILIILGFVLDAITFVDFHSWGVLETLGIGGIITFMVANRTKNEKILLSILILTTYSLLYYNPAFMAIISMPHGGPIGALSYSVISIIGFMVAEALYTRRSDNSFFMSTLKIALTLLILGALLSLAVPINKTHASPSFILAATGAVLIFYLVFFVIYKYTGNTFDRLRMLGKTALAMWIIQYVFGWIFLFILQEKQFLDFSAGLIVSIAVTLTMYFIAIALDKYKLISRIRL